MESLNSKVFKQIIDKDYSLEQFDWGTYVGLIAEIVESRDVNPTVIGKLAVGAEEKYGKDALKKLAIDIEETTGKKFTYTSLRIYRWVFSKLKDVEVPDDITYQARKYLAATEDPEAWVKKVVEEGLNSKQLIREIKIDKGLKPQQKLVTCPHCNKTFEQ